MAETPARRIGRMLTLVPWLAARPGITLEETASHFGITVEALEADLWQVILCGLPGYGPDQLVDIDFWDDGEIYVRDAQTLTAPMRLSLEEGAALLLGLHALAQTPGVENGESILSAAAKVEAALSIEALTPRISPPTGTSAETVAVLEEALANSTAVEIEYGAVDQTVTSRTVWPHHVVSIDGIAYMSGWCARAESIRTFRVDRIVNAHAADAGSSPGTRTATAWWTELDLHTARVRVESASRWILEEASSVRILQEAPTHIEAMVAFANPSWVASWVVRHPGSLEVVEPVWVREFVEAHVERLLGAPILIHR